MNWKKMAWKEITDILRLRDQGDLSFEQIAERYGMTKEEVIAAYQRGRLAYLALDELEVIQSRKNRAGALARELIRSPARFENFEGILKDREFMFACRRAIEDGDRAKVDEMFTALQAWDAQIGRGGLFRIRAEDLIEVASAEGIDGQQLEWLKELKGKTITGRASFDLRTAIRADFIDCFVYSATDQDAVQYLFGEGEEEREMVTIKEIAELAGKSVNTVRFRIYQARSRNELEVKTVRGALLVPRDEALRIALEPRKRGRRKKVIEETCQTEIEKT